MTFTTDEERRAKNRARVAQYRVQNLEKVKAINRKSYYKNVEKRRARNRQYRLENKEKIGKRDREYKRRTRTRDREKRTNGARERRLRRQIIFMGRPIPAVCDICAEASLRMCADHCHEFGHGRGWICGRCNLVLGKVGDSTDLLRKMIAYLAHHAVRQSPQLALPGF